MWIDIQLRVSSELLEPLSDLLLELGAISVDITDADAGTTKEQAQFGEPGMENPILWANSRLSALFNEQCDIDAIVQEATSRLNLTEPLHVEHQQSVPEQNWVQLTQSQFDPIQINDKLWIVPTWCESPDVDAINIVLDPGMAFGTGSHPTTQLCLEWLTENIEPSDTVLDYGCGSGILSIAAAKLGAQSVYGVDIDANALETAKINAVQNHCQLALFDSSSTLTKQFSVIVANILTNPLCVLAPLLASYLQSGAKIALSGILETQAEQVIAAYKEYVNLVVGDCHQGWVRLQNYPL